MEHEQENNKYDENLQLCVDTGVQESTHLHVLGSNQLWLNYMTVEGIEANYGGATDDMSCYW